MHLEPLHGLAACGRRCEALPSTASHFPPGGWLPAFFWPKGCDLQVLQGPEGVTSTHTEAGVSCSVGRPGCPGVQGPGSLIPTSSPIISPAGLSSSPNPTSAPQLSSRRCHCPPNGRLPEVSAPLHSPNLPLGCPEAPPLSPPWLPPANGALCPQHSRVRAAGSGCPESKGQEVGRILHRRSQPGPPPAPRSNAAWGRAGWGDTALTAWAPDTAAVAGTWAVGLLRTCPHCHPGTRPCRATRESTSQAAPHLGSPDQ